MPTVTDRFNLSTDLRDVLRRRIADGDCPPGARINEVHLARDLKVSRTPLREALSQLTAEGLVESRPRRGFFAKALTVDEAEQLYPVRGLLDPEALRLAGLPDARRIDRLRGLNERLAAAAGRPARVIELDNQWHRLLLDGCPNKILLDLIDQLIWKTWRYEYAYMSRDDSVTVASAEHDAILDALDDGNLARACALLRTNMSSALPALVAWLQSQAESQP